MVLNAAARSSWRGIALPRADFAGPKQSFPIPDQTHAVQALRERKFAPNPSAIVAAVKAKFPGLGGNVQRGLMLQKMGAK